jgi:hypothetical protein
MERLRTLILLLGFAAVLATGGCIVEDDFDDDAPDVDVDVDPPVDDGPDVIIDKDDPDIIVTPPTTSTTTTTGGQ